MKTKSKSPDMKNQDLQRYHVPNLERALAILELLAKHPDGLSMVEISGILAFPNNSVYRITSTLVNHGYLNRDEHSKRFNLSRKLLALGFASLSEQNIVEMSIDIMRELRDATRETVLLATLLSESMVVLEQVPGSHPFKFMVDAGSRLHLHTSAPGKALLAFLPESERESILKGLKLPGFNPRTITKKTQFRDELERVRQQGYALDFGEQLEGVHCVGAPVLNERGYPIAAIWITGPRDRMPESSFLDLGRQVEEHALQISRRFGYNLL
jgi:DNA-binding IclR family transcriptional regulator